MPVWQDNRSRELPSYGLILSVRQRTIKHFCVAVVRALALLLFFQASATTMATIPRAVDWHDKWQSICTLMSGDAVAVGSQEGKHNEK